jgi:hypothetical protein
LLLQAGYVRTTAETGYEYEVEHDVNKGDTEEDPFVPPHRHYSPFAQPPYARQPRRTLNAFKSEHTRRRQAQAPHAYWGHGHFRLLFLLGYGTLYGRHNALLYSFAAPCSTHDH